VWDRKDVVECNLCHICYFMWRFVVSVEFSVVRSMKFVIGCCDVSGI
jgi:hypothetical protein